MTGLEIDKTASPEATWKSPPEIRELGLQKLRFTVALDRGFTNTQELSAAHDFVGQERKVRTHLAEVRDHILDHLVVVNNEDTTGAPVLIEAAPTHMNLFGRLSELSTVVVVW
jgi:hypothetical protein